MKAIAALIAVAITLVLAFPAQAVTLTVPLTGTATAGGGGGGVLTLVNGPPNIPYAGPTSCTISTCTWIQAGMPSGSPVSDVYLDMVPMSQDYTGNCPGTAYTLSGPQAGNFAISCSVDGKPRNVGHIVTNGTVGAGDYDITVNAGSVSQRMTVHAVACTSSPAPGNNTIPTMSGVVCLGNGTYNVSAEISTNSNSILIGQGPSQSIVDGTGDTAGGFICDNCSATNFSVRNITFQNFNISGVGSVIIPTDRSVVANVAIINVPTASARGMNVGAGATVANSLVKNTGYSGIFGNFAGLAPSGIVTTVIGTEITGCNQGHNNIYFDVGCLGKFTGNSADNTGPILKNNYIHDNLSAGMWCDDGCRSMTVTGNTIINSAAGLSYEISAGIEVSGNAFQNNNVDNSNTTCFGDFCPSAVGEIFVSSSTQANVHDNNILVPAAGPAGGNRGPNVLSFTSRNGTSDNIVFYRNTTTFADDNGIYGYNSDQSSGTSGIGTCASGSETAASPTCSNDNTFYVQSGNTGAAHFQWAPSSNPTDWNSYRSATGQDANSQLLTGSAGIASGCTHVACSSAGVGAGGVPQ